jgi:hydroxymethylpyrimidine/phosphomethylpyrimidine kinase
LRDGIELHSAKGALPPFRERTLPPTLYPGDMPPIALTIAGSDPSGGAGIQADLKTFHQFGVYGEAVIALLTVQNTVRVSRVVVMPPALVLEQLAAVLEDIPPGAAKTGALGSTEMVEAVARAAADFKFPLVVDPVMVSKHGLSLLPNAAVAAVRDLLLPRAFLITPNVPEAEALTGMEVHSLEDMRLAACRLRDMGARAVLIKGGHLEGDATDLLFAGAEWHEFPAPRVATPHTHGTGCTYSAAITACLALGLPLAAAVGRAKRFIHEAILTNPGLGKGSGPVNHHARVD